MDVLLQWKKYTNFFVYQIHLDSYIWASETESAYYLQNAVVCTESSWRLAFCLSSLDKEGLREALSLVSCSAVAW